MKTLYDLLGARPDDDAEKLKSAFRKAAKANHPDLHVGDQDAPMRFRQIVEAYDILRDAEQRATYDWLLAFKREQLRSKSKRTISYFMYKIVFDSVAVVGLASVLVGGYTIFTHVSKAPVEAVKVVAITAPGPAKVAAVQPARTDTTEPDGLRDKLERVAVPDMPMMAPSAVAAANDGGVLDVTKGGPVPSLAGPNTEVAKTNGAFDVPMDQADAKPATDYPDDKVQSVEIQFSSTKKDNGVPKSSLSVFAMSNDERDIKIPDTHDMGDMKIPEMKIPEMKIPGRPRTVTKRQAANRPPFKQASLESKNTTACSASPSCSDNIPPLFGVGF